MSFFSRNKIAMFVCDMAGTIVNEKGLIYKAIHDTLITMGVRNINTNDINAWYGRDKSEVIRTYLSKNIDIQQAEKLLISNLREQYFDNSQAQLIDNELFDFFDKLRINNIKVCLNTGYSKKFQNELISHFNISPHIDDYISSEEVTVGRPYPYMIYKLMERNYIMSPKNVMKIGDTTNDIKEGINAGCGQTIGVLSGASERHKLINAGADAVIKKVTDLKDCDLPVFLL